MKKEIVKILEIRNCKECPYLAEKGEAEDEFCKKLDLFIYRRNDKIPKKCPLINKAEKEEQEIEI